MGKKREMVSQRDINNAWQERESNRGQQPFDRANPMLYQLSYHYCSRKVKHAFAFIDYVGRFTAISRESSLTASTGK